MMNTVRRLALALVALSAAPAFADDNVATPGPVTHTDQLVVVTPNAPIVITNGAQPTSSAPGAVAPVAAAPQSANGAPQNEDWNNVSHINGQLVKVGERSDYLVKFKKTNISTNPIGWMFGFYGVSASYAVSNNIVIRGDANLFSLNNGHETGYELGVSAPIYFKRAYSGPFIEPGIITRALGSSYDSSCDATYGSCMSSSTTNVMVGPEMLFGWHWTFDSGLNVAMALGAARNLNNSNQYGDGIEPAGYFRIGYAF